MAFNEIMYFETYIDIYQSKMFLNDTFIALKMVWMNKNVSLKLYRKIKTRKVFKIKLSLLYKQF